ncbi:MAG TPA: hypothetical protein VFA10_19545 [Ktedonobacteraceae bacterium]|nr:hypothetical protein [Ktedonobacteraceae bacterium]
MVEVYVERIHTEHAVLDIGEDIGALVIYTGKEFCGKEIQVSLKGSNSARMIHTAVWERRFNGRAIFAGLYPSLPVGDYIIWTHPSREVTIVSGCVAEVDLRNITDIYVPNVSHSHRYDQSATDVYPTAPGDARRDLLPPRYRNGKVVSAAPMGAAPLRYTDDGQIAWNEIWTDFCDLALAGGPSHRGTLLEPVTPEEVRADQQAYERVVAEIERGLQLVTGLPTVRSESLGWVGVACPDEEMALWLLRAIVVENVCVRREGNVLFLPAGPTFRPEKEIKNVITVVAKTHHYWREHLCSSS